MKLSGHLDYQLNQAQNLVLEMVTSLPVFLPEFKGRIIFVSTPGVNYGVYYGADAIWTKLDGSGGSGSLIVTYDFLYLGILPIQTVDSYVAYTTVLGHRAVKAGYIVGNSALISPTRTAGSIIVTPAVNGTPIGDTRLTATLDASNPQYHYRTLAEDPAFAFSVGDLIGIKIESDAPLLPASGIDVSNFLTLAYI